MFYFPNEKTEKIFLSLTYFVFLFVSSFSSGIYVFVCGLLPVMIGYCGYRWYNYEKISALNIKYYLLICVILAAGYQLNKICHHETKDDEMTFCGVMNDELRDNIFDCLLGLFEVFEEVVYDNAKALSLKGVDTLIRMGGVWLLFFCAVYVWRRMLKKNVRIQLVLFVAIFLWNTMILCVCKIQYGSLTFEYCYHLIGVVPLLLAVRMLNGDWYRKAAGRRRGFICVMICVLVVLNATLWGEVLINRNDVSPL